MRRWLSWTFLSVIPALAVIAALAAIGAIGMWHILIAICIAICVSGVAARLIVVRLERIRTLMTQVASLMPSRAESGVRGGFGEFAELALRLRQSYSARIEMLEHQLAKADLVIEFLPVPLLIADSDKQIVRANQAVREIFGQAGQGTALSAAIRDPSIFDAVDAALAGADGQDVELSIANGLARHFLAHVLPVRAPEGDGNAVIIALTDLTEAKRIDQTRSDFIANVSHELRTPLAALVGFIETLQGPARADVAAQERFLVLMQEQSERMSRLVGDLMSLSRVELNQHSRPSGQVDAIAGVQHVVEFMQIKAAKKSVGLRLKIGRRPAIIAGDDDEITQVIQNLLDNAIKYSPEGSNITIAVGCDRTAEGDEEVRITVRDAGEGIEPEHLPRLTERFYRVDAARSRALGGTGLGLAIVKHIVIRHGGRLTIDSVPGEGSSFAVILPAAPADNISLEE